MCFKRLKGVDAEEAKMLYEGTEEKDYIQKRILPQIEYYSGSSRRFRLEYYVFSIGSIILMAAVPIITMLPDTISGAKYVSASISAIASVLSSILLLRGTRDNWIEYRSTSEMLKSELYAFKAKSVEYKIVDYNQRFRLFVDRCESIMQAERTGWYSRMKTEPDQINGVSGTSEDTGS